MRGRSESTTSILSSGTRSDSSSTNADGRKRSSSEAAIRSEERVKNKGSLVAKSGSRCTSEWWSYFSLWTKCKSLANCNLCSTDVSIGEKGENTSHLRQSSISQSIISPNTKKVFAKSCIIKGMDK